jgi:hypothetical protein
MIKEGGRKKRHKKSPRLRLNKKRISWIKSSYFQFHSFSVGGCFLLHDSCDAAATLDHTIKKEVKHERGMERKGDFKGWLKTTSIESRLRSQKRQYTKERRLTVSVRISWKTVTVRLSIQVSSIIASSLNYDGLKNDLSQQKEKTIEWREREHFALNWLDHCSVVKRDSYLTDNREDPSSRQAILKYFSFLKYYLSI